MKCQQCEATAYWLGVTAQGGHEYRCERHTADLTTKMRVGPYSDDAHARDGDRETSHEAAQSLDSDRLRESQLIVLDLFTRHGPMCHQDLLAYIQDEGIAMSDSGARTRCSELVKDKGLLKDTGERVTLPSHRRSIIWGLAEPPA